MIYKLILGAVIVLAFAYIGYEIDKYYKNRLAVAEDYLLFVAYADRETEFMKTELCELMRGYGARNESLKKSLEVCADSLEKTNEPNFECKALPKYAVKEICDFILALSRSDYATRRSVIKNAYSQANELKDTAVKEKTQKGELIRKLCILLGIGLLIIII